MAPAVPSADTTPKLPGQDQVAWTEVDPQQYLDSNPAVREQLSDTSPEAVLRFYLGTGQRLGHSPNRFFDEAWYRRAYPDVAAGLGRGPASGFDHYCRGGFRTYAPHWLFDERLYRRRNPDLTEDVLDAARMANGYDHYLRHGAREWRIGHPFFDAAFYQTQLDPDEARESAAEGPFQHYLRRIAAGRHEVRTSWYFDPLWYLAKYPDVAEAIARGVWRCALHHYLTNDTPTAFDPLPEFSESWYLARYPDIATAVERGDLRNGYRHFLLTGATELRSPSEAIDLRYYADHDAVRIALRAGETPDAFTHYLAIGRAQGLPTNPPPDERVTEGQAKTLFRRRAANLLPLYGRMPIDFACAGEPAVSVIMVAHNRFALTAMALASLRSNYAVDLELILVNSGSTDEIQHIGRYVLGARLLRFDTNIGFLRGCNAAMQCASADAVLLLNNDVELAPGAVAAALTRLRSDASIGAVGGKVIRTHGLLQEAGNIVWGDGATSGYLRGASPLVPEANFVRDVDFCSGVFLMLRRSWLDAVGGFDEAFAPAYYEDADLCLRIAAAGARVVYDPSVVIHHLEYGSVSSALASETAIARNVQTFVHKHRDLLSTRGLADSKTQVFARFAGPRRMRVLFIEDLVPLRMLGSGFVRSNDIIRTIASLGCQVTVFPVNDSPFEAAAVFSDMPDTVEVMYDRTLIDLPAFLAGRPGYYDVVWITRTHNLDRVRELIERATAAADRRPRLILDTEAIASQRTAMRAALADQATPFDFDAALREEFAHASMCAQVVAVSDQDAVTLRGLGLPRVAVIGHTRELQPTPRDFTSRAGMLFIGALHDMESPNYDGLCWFADQVLPLIERALRWETRLTVVGYTGEKVSLDRFRDNQRITLLGAVAHTERLYDTHRLFIAPTRYAAGTPYKIYEAASFGLPIVATDLLCRQMGWEDGVDLLTADSTDPAGFADRVVRLYRDPDLWQQLRDNALQRLRTENAQEQYATVVRTVLEG